MYSQQHNCVRMTTKCEYSFPSNSTDLRLFSGIPKTSIIFLNFSLYSALGYCAFCF